MIFAAVCVVAVAVIAYGMMRVLRPELYPGEGLLEGTWSDLDRALLHFELGGACMFVGCPPIRDLWLRGYGADLWLLAGAFVIGIGGGVAGGVWCAMRPRTLSARLLEAAAMLLYCTPVYVMGLALLLLFNPVFGALALPWFFDPNSCASPLESPWNWFRSLLFPWLIVAAPLGAACLRLTLAGIVDALDEDYVRTGVAKGVRSRDVVRRHAAPASYPTDFGAHFRWDALLPDGTWEPVESERPVPSIAYTLRPGATAALNALVFPELQPGPHRMVRTVDGPDEELTLYAPFEVLPPSAR